MISPLNKGVDFRIVCFTMRVLVITKDYPSPHDWRRAAFNRQQIRELSRSHEVRVVAPLHWTEVVANLSLWRHVPHKYVNEDGIEVRHPIYYYTPRILEHRYGEFFHRSVRSSVARALENWRPDVILSCWAHPDGWASVKFAREFGLPVVIKVIGTDILVLGKARLRWTRIRDALCDADGVAAVSKDLAEHAERLGAERGKISVVWEGLDSQLFTPGDQAASRARLGLPPHERIVLFVGSLLLSKGVGVLIEAFRMLRSFQTEVVPDCFRERISCYLIGSGRDERKFRGLIASCGLQDCVFLRGSCPQDCLPDWYRACDIVALPSYSEGIPNVLRETIACGRPFVATPVGGIPEIADPSYSRLVEPGNVAQLADAMTGMLAEPLRVDPDLVRRINPTWGESVKRLEECLERAVRKYQERVCGLEDGVAVAEIATLNA